jgi:hypothetical protein
LKRHPQRHGLKKNPLLFPGRFNPGGIAIRRCFIELEGLFSRMRALNLASQTTRIGRHPDIQIYLESIVLLVTSYSGQNAYDGLYGPA